MLSRSLICWLQLPMYDLQLHTLRLAAGPLVDSLGGWEVDCTGGAASMAATRCSAGTAGSGLMAAELEGTSEATFLSGASAFTVCVLDCPPCAACCVCSAPLAAGKAPAASSAVLLLLSAPDACCSWAYASSENFAGACRGFPPDVLGSPISSTLCRRQHSVTSATISLFWPGHDEPVQPPWLPGQCLWMEPESNTCQTV